MDNDESSSSLLDDHPIFSPSKSSLAHLEKSLELSSNTLPTNNGSIPCGRRQTMALRDTDIVLAAGQEIRMASLADTKIQHHHAKNYKTLHTPNIQFQIDQVALNSTGKLLAVAGAYQVAVVVLPHAGYSRLVPERIDCKSIQIGQFYHGASSAAPIAQIEWHPWGEAASTLMVMTVDGKLREYDISVDTEEPQQVLSFIPERKPGKSFVAEDASEREVVSFALGKGRADWGPLTVYAVMRSGDVYAICPYMPQNASVPSAYVHSLECFISAKQEFLEQEGASQATKNLSVLYDYQHKYISALLKQLPPGTVFPAPSRSVLMHPPTTIKVSPARQGPFLLQPSPRLVEGSEGGDATDIIYLSYSQSPRDDDTEDGVAENLDVILITYQDGKVDVCLDVEKVEARWQTKNATNDLPMLAVYESIDLGLVSLLSSLPSTQGSSALNLLQGNFPVSLVDPVHNDIVYIYHAFGVHALQLRPVLQNLFSTLHADATSGSHELSAYTAVQPILSTFSVERKSSNPVIAVAIPDDVYLSYSIYVLTSAMRITVFSLNPRAQSPPPPPKENVAQSSSHRLELIGDTPPYTSLLGSEPWTPPPIFSQPLGLPSNPRLSVPKDASQREFMLTPDTLRYLATIVTRYSGQIHEVELAQHGAEGRVALQVQELGRLTAKCRELLAIVDKLKGPRREASQIRMQKVQEEQKLLLKRLDRMLQVMMQKASPELSEHETKWFEELKRMKEVILGADKYDESALSTRIRTLEREYDRLMPSLKALLEKERRRREKAAEENKSLGFSQAFEFGERSNYERGRLADLEQDVIKLAEKLDVTLSKPPSSQ